MKKKWIFLKFGNNVINTVQCIILCGLGLSISFLLKEPLDEMSSEVTHLACSILYICLCSIVFSSITFSEIDKRIKQTLHSSFFSFQVTLRENEIMNLYLKRTFCLLQQMSACTILEILSLGLDFQSLPGLAPLSEQESSIAPGWLGLGKHC